MALGVLFAVCLFGGVSIPSLAVLAAVQTSNQNSASSSNSSLRQSVPASGSQSTSPPTKSTSPAANLPAQPGATHKKKQHRTNSARHKVIVRDGGTSDSSPQLSTAVSPEQASRERKNTAGLLATAGANLQKLSGRSLNPSQQEAADQTRSYIQQAQTAQDAGDLQSAHNLAYKALLLSNELTRK